MGVNFDVNKGMQNKTTKKLIIILVIVIIVIFIFLAFNGKHNKTPIFENNIPEIKKDSFLKDSSHIQNISGDYINGNKTVNNYNNDTSNRNK